MSEGGIPYRFERSHDTAEVVEGWSALAPGEESGAIVGVAGRIMLLRRQGKAAFAQLRDGQTLGWQRVGSQRKLARR